MKFSFLASFIILIALFSYKLKRSIGESRQAQKSFWEKEREANCVRRKSLDNLPYVSFPFDRLPSAESFTESGNEVPESLLVLKDMKDKKMVNLNGISNTDLKLQYGTANITPLTEYDTCYEQFSKHIYLLAQRLDELGRTDEALFLLEETLPTGTDVSGHYRLLAEIYKRKNEPGKIAVLKEYAQKLTSLTKEPILRSLDEALETYDAAQADL